MLLENTTQKQPLPGTSQVENSAGGFGWQLDDWGRVDRFLILGCEGGTYYAGERELVLHNAEAAQRCIAADGLRLINRIVAISESGRAPKNDPAIFLLAMTAKLGDEPTRRAAYRALPKVCRIGTHLMHFAHYAQGFGGWGRGMRKAVGSWFNARPATELAYQLAKYQARDGWSNRDLLRLAHPRAASPSHDRLFAWAVKGQLPDGAADDSSLALIVAMQELSMVGSDVATAAEVIRMHRVPRECVPTPLLRHPEIWDALLESMPFTAMIRNLATMTRVGLIAVGAEATTKIARGLRNADRIAKARVHPLSILAALVTYQSGRGRGEGWIPVVEIVDGLDAAFYTSFASVQPANKRMLLALDVSGSMASGSIAGVAGLTPRIGSAAMALVTAATEANHSFVGFTASESGGYGGKWGGRTGITPLDISPRKRLDEVVTQLSGIPFGGTDCALPMIWAKDNKVDVDTFVVYTDGETWAGDVHPAEALRAYRDARGIPAKLVVVGMTSNGFSIADPDDAGMLDVVGFDTSTPPVLSDFARA
ncbi:MAG: TROVE domain-containing protein [Gemmatimonadaceae bacterium]|nr:TROVE domain-containing protein [Gemmatimonadaceae bacterium]